MFFTKDQARQLEVLVHPDVEKAILTMLDAIKERELKILTKEDAKIEELKLFQGKMLLINELKDYKQRLLDAVKAK